MSPPESVRFCDELRTLTGILDSETARAVWRRLAPGDRCTDEARLLEGRLLACGGRRSASDVSDGVVSEAVARSFLAPLSM